jgi:dTDP-glucose 4,6-dehydratase
MNILLTGGAGFIGSHVLFDLTSQGHHVVLLDKLDHSGTLERIKHLHPPPSYRYVYHDLKAPLNALVRERIGRVDMILHLAAMSHVDRSIQDPVGTVHENVLGTVNLLEFARSQPTLQHFIYFSTDEVFGPADEGAPGFKEWDRYNSANPYAASKAAAEEFVLAYANTYGIPVSITHTMNVYGPLQAGEKYIPSTIRKLLAGEQITVHADRTCTNAGKRTYIHVSDVCAALGIVMRLPPQDDKYNIVGEREVDNLEVAKTVAKVLGVEGSYQLVDFHSSRPGHDLRYALDGSKLESFGFKHKYPFEKGIEDTVKWYLNNKEWFVNV